ncbi:MAG: alpha/beta hydrolase [Candidatus Zambryskibacteria bacterium]|nr:alpha/beta hydrolase [Candidatus Zambryskibacteria bacterium]
MKKFFSIFLLAFYFLLFTTASATITNPYTVDEKSQVLFGDSITITATSTYNGLESYTTNYVNNYLHITFTYTHLAHGAFCCFASYPPRLYITGTDPTATTTPEIKLSKDVYLLAQASHNPDHITGWYLYDIQFDATGYTVVVKRDGETEIYNEHVNPYNFTGHNLSNTDWAALANLNPIQDSVNSSSMAFTPLNIYSAPALSSPATTTPVIIVPGIIGSKLIKLVDSISSEIWPAGPLLLFPFDLHLNDLILGDNGVTSTSDIQVGDLIDVIGDSDFFSGLIELIKLENYQKGKDLFTFPYDWRLDIDITAEKLKEKIDGIKAERGVTKVDLVAHSMGGLVVKKYLHDNGGDSVDKFIDIGTPHTGAPKAFKILNYGDSLDATFFFSLLGLNSERVKIISQNMPAVYQLLPSREYFNDSDNDYKYYVFDAVSGSDRLTFDQTSTYMKSAGRNSALVDRANEFHQEIDNLDPATYGVETYNIVGCGTPTIGQFYILDNTDDHYIYNIKMINGDGTVPLKSAEAMPATGTYYVKSAKHALMPSTSGVKELITSLLSTTTPDISLYSNLSTTSSGCNIPDGRIVSFHSPIELHIYDSSDNHTGPDSNGDIENEITGVTFEVIDDNKFAFLPNGVEYIIKGNATAEGTFDVRIQELVSGEVATTTLFTGITLTATTQTQFTVNSNTPTQIILDHENDGVYESVLNVSTTTTGLLESTGKVAAVATVAASATDFGSSKSSATSSEPIIETATSTPDVIETTSSLTLIPLNPVNTSASSISKKLEPGTKSLEPVQFENTAIVYKSFGQKFKSVFLGLWLWVKSKL